MSMANLEFSLMIYVYKSLDPLTVTPEYLKNVAPAMVKLATY